MSIDAREPGRVDDRTANDRAMDALVALLELGRGRFTLAFVSYEWPSRHRDWIIPRLRFRLPSWNLAEVSLVDPELARPPSAEGLFAAIERAAARSVGGQPIDALLLTDWEKAIDFDYPEGAQPASALLGVFNMGRGLFKQTFACPVVVFVPDRALVTLLELAPDFASWQSGSFAFAAGPEVYRTELEEALRSAGAATGPDRPVVARWLDAVLADLDRCGGDGVPRGLIAEARAGLGELSIELGHKAQALAAFGRLRRAWAPRWWARAWSGTRRAARLPAEPRPDADPWAAFRGAAALKEGDELFGRDDDLTRLIDFLTRPGYRCGTLWGETGSGKTSLLRAGTGLQALLRQWGALPVLVNAYGPDPGRDIRSAVARAAGLPGEPPLSMKETLRDAAAGPDRPIFVLCDQFEQVFTGMALPSRKRREPFLGDLAGWINDVTLPVRFLLVLRADHLFHLAELDRFAPFFRQLDKENYYELLWLSEPDAIKVLRHIRDASGAAWTDALMTAIVRDLAMEADRIKPVEIQLLATTVYLRGIETPEAYAEAGGKERLLTEYLNTIFDTLPDPTLARRILRKLVDPDNQLIRPWRSARQISGAADIRQPEARVAEALNRLEDRFHIVQRPEAWERADPAADRYQLVHDVLIVPALIASSPQEIGLGIVRPALARGRRFLSPRELRAVLRSDLAGLSPLQARRARNLVRSTRWLLTGGSAAVAALVLVAALGVVQLASVHLRAASRPPYPLIYYSGLRRLDFLPWPMSARPLLDTGLAAGDIAARQSLATIESDWFLSWGFRSTSTTRRVVDQLDQATAGPWRCYIGDWPEGLRILCGQAVRADTLLADNADYKRIAHFAAEDRGPVQNALHSFLDRREKKSLRIAAILWIVFHGQEDTDAVPHLVKLLDDDTRLDDLLTARDSSSVRGRLATMHEVSAVALASIGANHPGPVISALAAAIRDRGASPSARVAAARALASLDMTLALRAAMALGSRLHGSHQGGTHFKTVQDFAFACYTKKVERDFVDDIVAHIQVKPRRPLDHRSGTGVGAAEVGRDPARAIRSVASRHGVEESLIAPVGVGDVPGAAGRLAADALLESLDDADPEVRLATIEALGAMGEFRDPSLEDRLERRLLSLTESGDLRARVAAVRALNRFGPPAPGPVLDRLVALLDARGDDAAVRAEAVCTLGQVGDARDRALVDRFVALLRDEVAEVSGAAAEALGRMGTAEERALVGLVRILGDEARYRKPERGRFRLRGATIPDTPAELTVGETVADVLGPIARIHPERVIPKLAEILDAPSTTPLALERAAAILDRLDSPLGGTSVSSLLPLLGASHSRVRRAVIEALGHASASDADQVAEKLMALAGDGDPMVQSASIRSLGEVAARASREPSRKDVRARIEARLLDLLQAGNPEVRAAAAGALGRIGVATSRIATALAKLLGDDALVRAPVLYNLPSLKLRIYTIPFLMNTITISDVAADALVGIGAAEPGLIIVTAALVPLLVDRNPGPAARVDAARALVALSGPRPGSVEGVGGRESPGATGDARSDGDLQRRLAPARALSGIDRGGAEAVAHGLVDRLRQGDVLLRAAAIEVLAQTGIAEAPVMSALGGLLDDTTRMPWQSEPSRYSGPQRDRTIGDAAADALAKIGAAHPERVVPAVAARLADREARPEARIAAGRVLERILNSPAWAARLLRPLHEKGIFGHDDDHRAHPLSLFELAHRLGERDPGIEDPLFHAADPSTFEQILERYNYDDERLAQQIARSIGLEPDVLPDARFLEVVRGWGAIDALTKALFDDNPSVQEVGIRGLSQLGATAREAVRDRIVALLLAPDPDVRLAAVAAARIADIDHDLALDSLAILVMVGSLPRGDALSSAMPHLLSQREAGGDSALEALIAIGRRHPDRVAPRLIPVFRDLADAPLNSRSGQRPGPILADGLADMVVDPRLDTAVLQSFWALAAHNESEWIRSAAIRAQSGRLKLRAGHDKPNETVPAALLLDELAGERSAGDALYRAAIVAALADELRSAGAKASTTLARLQALRQDQERAWLRVAAWQVLIRYHELREAPRARSSTPVAGPK
jgi:hypothetical protein